VDGRYIVHQRLSDFGHERAHFRDRV
jgi:hypothetical protein